ncbi:MAG TPA: peptidoglycan synthetase, partial [Paludibacteraceae bacterium]|nr:peptidoglycan synthetase [Paludibacteraceae bacterium]
TEDFLPQYYGSMSEADIALVYYDPEVIKQKQLQEFSPTDVKNAFGEKVEAFNRKEDLLEKLHELNYENTVVLFMSSGNFSGINLEELTNELIKNQ